MDPVERVKNMVRHTLVVKPDVTNRELMGRAREIAPEAVEGLSLRQFHGKFRLPVIRYEMTPKKPRQNGTSHAAAAESAGKPAAAAVQADGAGKARKSRSKKSDKTDVALNGAVREVLIDFAVELEKAESRSDLVSVVAGVDEYVRRILKVADNAYSRGSRKQSAA